MGFFVAEKEQCIAPGSGNFPGGISLFAGDP